jgi:CHAT domain-containing protein
MFETPSVEPLQKARAKRFEIMAIVKPSIFVKTLEYPDVASVMTRPQQCDIVHFAYHGVSNPVDSSKSDLILQTTIEESRQNILNVRIACQAYLAHAKIAHLLTYSIAQNWAMRLLDEVLHVVSEFQVVGFEHVVGFLWSSNDNVCVDVAKSFYFEFS